MADLDSLQLQLDASKSRERVRVWPVRRDVLHAVVAVVSLDRTLALMMPVGTNRDLQRAAAAAAGTRFLPQLRR